MSKVRSAPLPVKLFIGMISREVSLFERLKDELQKLYGPLDMQSPVWDWAHTDYYLNEMGEGLKRQFIFFKELIDPGAVSAIKLKTIELENQHLNENKGRWINIDPGYLDSARVVLVSAKDFSHRVYIGNSIYAEATLVYSGNNYQTMPYTYPDFMTDKCFELFKKARALYKEAAGQRP
ncbi:MAG TPA: DUF4416 family protein [Nitrospirae bacterium]|nr:hypothetical protein BMS3Abin10_00358 [bacterium BMS3Abin10]GBE40092.1 hypothetical protein BMS3Bbin08_02730 [bacterium BMS3Bbin08]HDH01429.1 DUF4416 family protein [Nitrospirota bacterium]HDH50751.1 DUF4416 family protein [Nitrospirota bacterium]HDK81764.1 DUF4416 family protein [Nitrospirota bacterium]